MTIKKITMMSLFTALIAIGAFIKIPIPVLPFTLQFLFTMLAGLLMGGKLGAISVAMYIMLGLMGLPIFTQGGGLGYVVMPTFGYLIGFLIGSYVTGKIANMVPNPSYKRLLASNFIGLLIVYGLGMVYYYYISNFYLHTPIGIGALFLYCFILAVPGDIVLCIVAAIIAKRLIPVIKKENII